MASTYLTRTASSGNRRIFTLSGWFKKSNIGSFQRIISSRIDGTNYGGIAFSSDAIQFSEYQGGDTINLVTNRLFRDPSAWMHLVVAVDTTQGTASNRVKFYINGVQETSFSTSTYPSQNLDTVFNSSSSTHRIGTNDDASGAYYDGSMSHFHFIDGTAYDASAFGETDSTTGEWKINTSPSVTYGNNGFFILKDGNSVTDQSGNSNNFTVGGGTLTKTEDNPSNVFATMATPTWYDGTIANGGLTITTNQTSYRYQPSSIGVSSGKWYWEVKLTTRDNYALMGITDAPSPINVGTDWILGSGAYDYSVVYNNGGGDGHKYNNAGTSPTNTPGAFMGGFAQGDIIMFALDCDNNTLKIGTNGLWSNGSGSTNQTFSNTTPISITAPTSTNTGFYFPAVGDYGGAISVFDLNFGNGYFGTTAVSSAGTNASGIGIFEYDVPSGGYTALSTKGLNS
jgi:hypothetical protein